MSSQLKTDFYRKRSFGDLFADTFAFTFRNIFPIIKAGLVFMSPVAIIVAILGGFLVNAYFSQKFFAPIGSGIAFPSLMGSWIAIIYILLFLFIGIVMYAVLNSYILRYAESLDGKVYLRDIWTDVKDNWAAYLGIAVVRMLVYLVILAFYFILSSFSILSFAIALIVTYLLVSTSMADIIRIYEGGSAIYSVVRSFGLVNKRWWATFGLYLVD